MSDYDVLDGVPCHVLGYRVKTKTQIILTCLVPAIFELLVYLFLTTADIALTIQHFRDERPIWASLTLTFLCLPAIICFISVVSSPYHWPDEDECGRENNLFLFRQLFNLIFFPIGAIHRYVLCLSALSISMEIR